MLLDRANRQKYSSARSRFKNLQAPSLFKGIFVLNIDFENISSGT